MKRLCVFCGSSHGRKPQYREAARQLGREMARRGIELVYGGGNIGLMGEVATAVLAAGGNVIGVLPRSMLERELAHSGIQDLRIVRTMHERKALMAQLSDGFIALPGGLGTFDELFEILTWSQLGIHDKPVGLLDVDDYFGPLWQLFEHSIQEGFVIEGHRSLLLRATDAAGLIDSFASYRSPQRRRWMDVTDT